MTIVSRRFARSVAIVIALIAWALPVSSPLLAAQDRLPDLRMLPPRDVFLCGKESGPDRCPTPPATGVRLLRFTTVMTNVGAGSFEVYGTRSCESCAAMTTRQVIQRSGASSYSIRSDAMMQFEAGDGHHHWHVQGAEDYRLVSLGAPLASGSGLGHKDGFCFFDGLPDNLARPSAPDAPRYPESGCGTRSSQHTRMGLSVGWGDVYPWYYAGQYIDVSKAPNGRYLLCMQADPSNDFRESNERNNGSSATLVITRTKVIVERLGSSCPAGA